MSYTITEYCSAINRELKKRSTTYPKIAEKKYKSVLAYYLQKSASSIEAEIDAINDDEYQELLRNQKSQVELLEDCRDVLLGDRTNIQDAHAAQIFRELQRESRMRKNCYPRWVGFKRMDAATAEMEQAVWSSLTIYFHDTYCKNEPWRKPRARRAA